MGCKLNIHRLTGVKGTSAIEYVVLTCLIGLALIGVTTSITDKVALVFRSIGGGSSSIMHPGETICLPEEPDCPTDDRKK